MLYNVVCEALTTTVILMKNSNISFECLFLGLKTEAQEFFSNPGPSDIWVDSVGPRKDPVILIPPASLSPISHCPLSGKHAALLSCLF